MINSSLRNIDVAILCGGLGTRLRAAIGEQQKTMALVGGRPFLDSLLEYLSGQGFRRAVLCAGYQGEKVAEYYRDGKFGMEILCSLETEPLGTGGAFKNAERFVQSDPFVAMNGDSICPLDYKKFVQAHIDRHADMSLAVVKVPSRAEYGAVAFGGDGRITGFEEKNPAATHAGFINTGIYCLNKAVLGWMPEQKFSIEKDFFPKHLDKKVFAFEFPGDFLDIGTPERFAKANQIAGKVK